MRASGVHLFASGGAVSLRNRTSVRSALPPIIYHLNKSHRLPYCSLLYHKRQVLNSPVSAREKRNFWEATHFWYVAIQRIILRDIYSERELTTNGDLSKGE